MEEIHAVIALFDGAAMLVAVGMGWDSDFFFYYYFFFYSCQSSKLLLGNVSMTATSLTIGIVE